MGLLDRLEDSIQRQYGRAMGYAIKATRAQPIISNSIFDYAVNNLPFSKPTKPASWKDNIDYSQYDEEIENKFRNEHDYLGLADYLEKFRMNNLIDQRQYESEIAQIRRYGRQYNAMTENATDSQIQSLAFSEAFDSGNIDGLDKDNERKKQYASVIKNLGKTVDLDYVGAVGPIVGDDEASTISITFNNKHVSYGLWGFGPDWMAKDSNKNQFTEFLNDNEYTEEDLRNLLGEENISRKDGKVTININKDDLCAIKFFTKVREWCNNAGKNTDDVSYASYDRDNKLISDNTEIIGSQIQNVSTLLNEIEQDKENVLANTTSEEQIWSTNALPYMNERQMQLKNLLDNGVISGEVYNAQMKADNDVYSNLLYAADFSKYKVYGFYNTEADEDEENKGKNLVEFDNYQRSDMAARVKSALEEGRVTWRAAISNGKYGTLLTISPKRNDKGELLYDEGDARNGGTFFIEDMFTKSVQNAFDSSTQGKTVAEINSMQQYGYEYKLNNGNVLSNVGNNGARLYDNTTKTYRDISREEAHDMLHESIIEEDASRNIRNRMFNLDGTVRRGYDYETAAKKIAVAGANEIYSSHPVEENDVWYPSPAEQARRQAEGNIDKDYTRQRALDLYSTIMNNIYKLINTSSR